MDLVTAYLFGFVAITCPPLLFRKVSSEDTELWSVVNVTCPAGGQFSEHWTVVSGQRDVSS